VCSMLGFFLWVGFNLRDVLRRCGGVFWGVGGGGGTRSCCFNSGYHDLGLL